MGRAVSGCESSITIEFLIKKNKEQWGGGSVPTLPQYSPDSKNITKNLAGGNEWNVPLVTYLFFTSCRNFVPVSPRNSSATGCAALTEDS